MEELTNLPFTLAYFAQKEEHNPSLSLYDTFEDAFDSLHQRYDKYLLGYPKVSKGSIVDDFLTMATQYQLCDYLCAKLASTQFLARSPSGHSYLYHTLRRDDVAKPILHSEAVIAFLLPRSCAEDMQEGWATAVHELGHRSKIATGDEMRMWLAVIGLFVENKIHTRTSIKPQAVLEVLAGFMPKFAQEVEKLRAMVFSPPHWRSWVGLSMPAQTRALKTWNSALYPARTWWLDSKLLLSTATQDPAA